MRSLWRWLRGAGRRGAGRPYEPLANLPKEAFEISGRDVVKASANYHEATLGWMMGVGLYRQIRVDRGDHLLRLVSLDRGTVVNRARGGRVEPVYRVAMRLRVGTEGLLTEWAMFDMLASDFDSFAKRAGWIPGGGGGGKDSIVRSPGMGKIGGSWDYGPDAHGRRQSR